MVLANVARPIATLIVGDQNDSKRGTLVSSDMLADRKTLRFT